MSKIEIEEKSEDMDIIRNLDEDDEFEEFEIDNFSQNVNMQLDYDVWTSRADWTEDDVEETFHSQLRAEIEKVKREQNSKKT
ncbi:hypothetical protein A3Q56_04532 [Intoshia linei]|uniref:26S proteasome complex subunit SEM1 n=1 Tax=Intoshia linei TaxID=1819745 RepID=A0A177B0I4_9BILA|nr:hypothetical protein A3Q56_04532 [Intoshia linei]